MSLFAMGRRDVILSCRTIDTSTVDSPGLRTRVTDALPVPDNCHLCGSQVALVNNRTFYGRERGWPLAYACTGCGARTGCHPGTTIPLGTLANQEMIQARILAHAAFDRLWRGQGPGARGRAYRALSVATGIEKPHIAWLGVEDCQRVIEACRDGLRI